MRKRILLIAVLALGTFGVYAMASAAVTDQKAIVSGTVVAEGLVQQGAVVEKGAVLVKVKSLVGTNIAAARATASGKVAEVLVAPGDKVVPQQVVARLSE